LSSGLERLLTDSGFQARDLTGIPAKAAAARARIATRRKNSLSYLEGGGSAVRIGVVATDFELEENPGPSDQDNPCGKCTLCLEG